MRIRFLLDEKKFVLDGKEYLCECIVRNEVNGWRGKNEPRPFMGKDKDGNVFYSFPRMFPRGEWKITRSVEVPKSAKDAHYLGKWFIQTNAFQSLSIWKYRKGAGYIEPTGKTFDDVGYGFHFCPKEISNTSVGCGLFRKEDEAEEVRKIIEKALAVGKKKKGFLGLPFSVE